MTGLTSVGEARRDVVGRRRSGEIRLMAACTVRRSQRERAATMAGGTRCRGMLPGQRKLSGAMIEGGTCPLIHAVAVLTGQGKRSVTMIDACSLFIVTEVTG